MSLTTGKKPHNNCRIYRKSTSTLYLAILSYLMFLATFIFAVVIFFLQEKFSPADYLFYGIGTLVIYLIHRIFAQKVDCSLCRGSLLSSQKNQKHQKAYIIKGLSFKVSAMITFLTLRSIRCMHCGTCYTFRKK